MRRTFNVLCTPNLKTIRVRLSVVCAVIYGATILRLSTSFYWSLINLSTAGNLEIFLHAVPFNSFILSGRIARKFPAAAAVSDGLLFVVVNRIGWGETTKNKTERQRERTIHNNSRTISLMHGWSEKKHNVWSNKWDECLRAPQISSPPPMSQVVVTRKFALRGPASRSCEYLVVVVVNASWRFASLHRVWEGTTSWLSVSFTVRVRN